MLPSGSTHSLVIIGTYVGHDPVVAIVLPSGRTHSRVIIVDGEALGGTVGQAPVVAIVLPSGKMHSLVSMPVLKPDPEIVDSSEQSTVRPSGRKQSLVTGAEVGGTVWVGTEVGQEPVVAMVCPLGRIHSLVMMCVGVCVGGREVTGTVGH